MQALSCPNSNPIAGGLLYITSVNNILELSSAVRLGAVGVGGLLRKEKEEEDIKAKRQNSGIG